ncbi:PadR family transcriptional regulator [Siphonobacter aquaeclarae]|uniref:Transcriptional regulator, PadR family n=1 Tax=Siphonobacter aquaeclarae TaxID=563176 RepID=A0A1G9I8I3_9BACT|nr:helix-turn-helix transcriptional regulator [Siphonobacter aquaeclarae]SDL21412.1 transcriptional regulator, PadR family [Siphonobacter aquaeclarae]
MKGLYLGELEELILLAVCCLGTEAYGVAIADVLAAQTGRDVHISAVHTVLYRLEEKGFLRSELGGATALRGGRRKRLFDITTAGKKALRETRDIRNAFWNRIPALVWEIA